MNTTERHHEHDDHEHEDYQLVADEVVFQINHPADEPQNIKERIIAVLEKFLSQSPNATPQGEGYEEPLEESYWRKRLEPDTARIITFSSLTQSDNSERFSLVPLKLIDHSAEDLTPDDVLRVLNDAYTELIDQFLAAKEDEGGENGTQRFNPIILDNNDPDVGLKSISANFLAGGAWHPKPTGGPGSLPASRKTPSGAQRKFKLKGQGTMDCLSPFRHPGASVAILDTAQELDGFPPQIRDLFVADPGMEVFLYPDQGLARYGQPPDHWDMNDHGTFIASIIRAITPSTKIYLYQVLNRFGGGSLVTVSQGLVDAVNQRGAETMPVILNCSFGFQDNLPEREELEMLSAEEVRELIFMSMDDAFAWVKSHPNIEVVASAGNDAKEDDVENGTQPDPWSPAKLNRVLSVAALPKDLGRDPARGNKFRPASYSNRAHAVGSTKDMAFSLATVGGERNQNPPYRSKGGHLGVYIGVIPRVDPVTGYFSQDDPPNLTGWARWSGTSFAAPVITALLAAQDNELEERRPLLPDPQLNFNNEQVIPILQG
jgi:subtilisin family serine protease